MAAYRTIAPSASSLFTRVQQEDGERPTFAASSLLVKRPSLISADRILRSIKSRRSFFATDGFADGVRPIGFSSRNPRLASPYITEQFGFGCPLPGIQSDCPAAAMQTYACTYR